MTMWSYTFTGSPKGDTTGRMEEDQPGNIVVAERKDEPGVCDLFVRTHRNDTYHTATFKWYCEGSPEHVMPRIPEAIIALSGSQR
jgi:hypothetical protein